VREEHRLKGLKTKCGGEYPQPKEMRKQRAAETYIMRALIKSLIQCNWINARGVTVGKLGPLLFSVYIVEF
jgi:hypothetical protein